jgi:hypothetical protein
MADAKRGVEFKSSLKLQDVANVKKVLSSFAENETSRIVGHIHGFCNDTVQRSSPDGMTKYEGMVGQFEAIPSDLEMKAIRSGICYLGNTFQGSITKILKEQAGADGKGQVTGVSFVYEVAIFKTDAGPEWRMRHIGEPEGLDPLAATRERIAAHLKATHDTKETAKKK